MKKEIDVLLGRTDNEIIFGNFTITDRNGYNEFTASFDTVAPFENEESNGVEYFEELLESCYNDEDKYRLCEQYDCSPSQLAEEMASDEGIDTIADEKDCSLFDSRIYVNGIEYAFESSSCGQHDIMEDEEMVEFTKKELVLKMYEYWKQYHLKEVDGKVLADILETMQKLEEFDKYSTKAEEIIKNYVEEMEV
jgi:hypothetical protein